MIRSEQLATEEFVSAQVATVTEWVQTQIDALEASKASRAELGDVIRAIGRVESAAVSFPGDSVTPSAHRTANAQPPRPLPWLL